MAYISQEEKKAIAAQLKKVIPQTWKYSLAVRDHSTLVLSIASAPVDLMQIINDTDKKKNPHRAESVRAYAQLSNHYLSESFATNPEISELFGKILTALKGPAYYDRSDSMTDYFDISHYIRVNIGKYDNPFIAK